MRVAKEVAMEGGVSDPRNGIMLKIFSMVNLGERAGSGLCSICNVWEKVFHTAAEIMEAEDVDRVILKLCNGGNEQDVDAMRWKCRQIVRNTALFKTESSLKYSFRSTNAGSQCLQC